MKKLPKACSKDITVKFVQLAKDNTENMQACVFCWVCGYCLGLYRGGIVDDFSKIEKVMQMMSNSRNYEKWTFLLNDVLEFLGGENPIDEILKKFNESDERGGLNQ
jgi:hypothetical protein